MKGAIGMTTLWLVEDALAPTSAPSTATLFILL
jgi:hypothetical protein